MEQAGHELGLRTMATQAQVTPHSTLSPTPVSSIQEFQKAQPISPGTDGEDGFTGRKLSPTGSERRVSVMGANELSKKALRERRLDNTLSSMLNQKLPSVQAVPSGLTVSEQTPLQPRISATIPETPIPLPAPPTKSESPPPLKREISVIPPNYPSDLAQEIRAVELNRSAVRSISGSQTGSDRYSWKAPTELSDESDGDWGDVKAEVNGNIGKHFLRRDAGEQGPDFHHAGGSDPERGSEHQSVGMISVRRALEHLGEVVQTLKDHELAERISNLTNISVQGSPSQMLLQPATDSLNEAGNDAELREGPSDARFAKDGFCSCSRFTRLTKADFLLLADADKAVKKDRPFNRMSELRDLVKKVKQQPRHEASIYYWLATLTNFTSWLTLADRRKEKNRIDNTFFFSLFRYRVKICMLTLSKQRLDRQISAYHTPIQQPDEEKTTKIDGKLADLKKRREKMNNLKRRQAQIGWTARSSEFDDDSEPELDPDDLEDTKDMLLDEDEEPAAKIPLPPSSPISPLATKSPPLAMNPFGGAQEATLVSSDLAKGESRHVEFVRLAGPKRASTAPIGQKFPKATAKERVTDIFIPWRSTDNPRFSRSSFSFPRPVKTKGKSSHKESKVKRKIEKKTAERVEEESAPKAELSSSLQTTTPTTPQEPEEEEEEEEVEDEKPPAEIESVFIVIGWFPDDLHEPNEIYVRVNDINHFLPDLKMHITALRGWRSVFSFKSVQGFGLYKCRTTHFAHSARPTTKDERVTLAHFFDATNRSYSRAVDKRVLPQLSIPQGKSAWKRFLRKIQTTRQDRRNAHYLKRQDSKAWAIWVHETMNLGNECPFESQLSLKMILDWSQRRIAIAALIPLALSLGVGLYYMLINDGVEGTSAAWTISSYIVTAGAFIIALIAILTALKDGQTNMIPKMKVSDESAV